MPTNSTSEESTPKDKRKKIVFFLDPNSELSVNTDLQDLSKKQKIPKIKAWGHKFSVFLIIQCKFTYFPT